MKQRIIGLKTLGTVEGHPLAGDRIEANIGEGELPADDAEVDDGEAEVAGERVSNEVPAAGEILEPDLRIPRAAVVEQANLRECAIKSRNDNVTSKTTYLFEKRNPRRVRPRFDAPRRDSARPRNKRPRRARDRA